MSVLDFSTQLNVEELPVGSDASSKATAQYEQAKKNYDDLKEKFKSMMENQANLLAKAEEKVNMTK
jgi:putative methionine-R-sulfoxide reductase with GAF domain